MTFRAQARTQSKPSKQAPLPLPSELRLPAIEIRQGPRRKLYAFSVDGKLITQFSTVSRIKRQEGEIEGYQRPEQIAHIDEIKNYIESSDPLLPNAVVIAFDKSVRFEPWQDGPSTDYSRAGELVIPVDPNVPEHRRPGFIVDGQQRIAAIREADIGMFPVCATAFIAGSIREQTEQFILVNSTKPLPKGLIHELLPETDAMLPIQLERRRLPAQLVTRLNETPTSPLYRAVKTATNPEGRVKDNSLLRIIENSLSDGVLYVYRDVRGSNHDIKTMYEILADFFTAVCEVFPEAWELPPKKSRLTHGAGIAGLGFLMDSIAHRVGLRKRPTKVQFAEDLAKMQDVCHWTDGFWDFGPGRTKRWDELQNTTKDIDALVRYLAAHYKAVVVVR